MALYGESTVLLILALAGELPWTATSTSSSFSSPNFLLSSLIAFVNSSTCSLCFLVFWWCLTIRIIPKTTKMTKIRKRRPKIYGRSFKTFWIFSNVSFVSSYWVLVFSQVSLILPVVLFQFSERLLVIPFSPVTALLILFPASFAASLILLLPSFTFCFKSSITPLSSLFSRFIASQSSSFIFFVFFFLKYLLILQIDLIYYFFNFENIAWMYYN